MFIWTYYFVLIIVSGIKLVVSDGIYQMSMNISSSGLLYADDDDEDDDDYATSTTSNSHHNIPLAHSL